MDNDRVQKASGELQPPIQDEDIEFADLEDEAMGSEAAQNQTRQEQGSMQYEEQLLEL